MFRREGNCTPEPSREQPELTSLLRTLENCDTLHTSRIYEWCSSGALKLVPERLLLRWSYSFSISHWLCTGLGKWEEVQTSVTKPYKRGDSEPSESLHNFWISVNKFMFELVGALKVDQGICRRDDQLSPRFKPWALGLSPTREGCAGGTSVLQTRPRPLVVCSATLVTAIDTQTRPQLSGQLSTCGLLTAVPADFANTSPKKKALLIGITYSATSRSQNSDFRELLGPHEDAKRMRTLLIDKYEYKSEDITLMLDGQGDAKLEPTRFNIRREIHLLVEDAQPGDRFVFFYSGHSGQIESKSRSEDDGMDEYIIPADHEGLAPEKQHRMIIDNELRKWLVDPLPIGARLTAIFDSCHSGTLLDLDHYLCNRVFFPWISKGTRRPRLKWIPNARRDAVDRSPTGVRIYQHTRLSGERVRTRHTSVDVLPASGSQAKQVSIKRRTSSVHSKQAMPASSLDSKRPADALSQVREEIISPPELEIPRCGSPVSYQCTGLCRPEDALHTPDVVSISACTDGQQTFEDSKGRSMTHYLVEQLNKNHHPSFKELMTGLGISLHKHARRMHCWGIKRLLSYERKQHFSDPAAPEANEEELPDVECSEFIDPQLGSQRPLYLRIITRTLLYPGLDLLPYSNELLPVYTFYLLFDNFLLWKLVTHIEPCGHCGMIPLSGYCDRLRIGKRRRSVQGSEQRLFPTVLVRPLWRSYDQTDPPFLFLEPPCLFNFPPDMSKRKNSDVEFALEETGLSALCIKQLLANPDLSTVIALLLNTPGIDETEVKRTRISLPSFSMEKWIDVAEQLGLRIYPALIEFKPLIVPQCYLSPSFHEEIYIAAWAAMDVYSERIFQHTEVAGLKLLDPWLVPVVALFRGRINDRPEEVMPRNKLSTGAAVEHMFFIVGHLLFFVIELKYTMGSDSNLAQLFLELLSMAEINLNSDFADLKIYGLLTDLTQFEFYAYDPSTKTFLQDPSSLITSNWREGFLHDMINVGNRLFSLILQAYIETLRMTCDQSDKRGKSGTQLLKEPSLDHTRPSLDKWQRALQLALDAQAQLGKLPNDESMHEESASEGLALLTQSVQLLRRVTTNTSDSDIPSVDTLRTMSKASMKKWRTRALQVQSKAVDESWS
ncbi:Metacaspase-1 [Grifola frondosa]|uniref:Metacaspase-1 n=1 Tax=Grifola frondosa TaxID=5627 RepID=A0A1C7LLC1_GRIFR|nr:Metacaspase-1 [Grifola frondosa]